MSSRGLQVPDVLRRAKSKSSGNGTTVGSRGPDFIIPKPELGIRSDIARGQSVI